MLNVSPELYEMISLAMRYVFAFLGVLIVLRTYRWLLSDRRARRLQYKRTPGAGAIGELIVLQGGPGFPPDTYLPVPREGTLGSSRACDLTIPCPGIHTEHLYFRWEDGAGLRLEPIRGSQLTVQSSAVPADAAPRKWILRHGDLLTLGEVVLVFQVYMGLRGDAGLQAQASLHESLSTYADHPSSGCPGPEWENASQAEVAPAASSPAVPEVPGVHTTPANASDDWSRFRRPRRSDRWKEDWSE